MRNFEIHWVGLSLRLGALLGLLALMSASTARAEGSGEFDQRDVSGTHDAHDQAVHNRTVMYVDITDSNNEKICWRGTGTLEVRRPNDTVLAAALAGGSNMAATTNGCVNTPNSTNGAYRVTMSAEQAIGTEWDIRVCADTATNATCRDVSNNAVERKGRLWSYSWDFESNTSFAVARSVNGSVYAIVPGGGVGRDAVVEMRMEGVSGAYYKLFANGIGPETSAGVRIGRSVIIDPNTSVSGDENRVIPTYPLYLSPPARALLNWTPPVVSDVNLLSTCTNNAMLDTTPGSIRFTSNITGSYVVMCDLDGTGTYDFAAPGDFSSFGTAVVGQNQITWNGTDNAGVLQPAGSYNCVVRLNVGEFHYVAQDIETSYQGIRMFRVETNRTDRSPVTMFWDDRAVVSQMTFLDSNVMPNGQNSATSPLAAGLNPGSYATATSAYYIVAGEAFGNARAWGDFNNGGAGTGDGKGNDRFLDTFTAADSVVTADPLIIHIVEAVGDADSDTLTSAAECAAGTDPRDIDTDNDGVNDNLDSAPLDPVICRDADGDSCNDCAITGADQSGGDIANDGADNDSDDDCDVFDLDDDNDGIPDLSDEEPFNGSVCTDSDGDGCDDCAGAAGSNPASDGPDFDLDGECDLGDPDDDNDGIADPAELGGVDLSLDSDNDGVADYLDSDAMLCDDLAAPLGECDSLLASVDADLDGNPNQRDLDADGDGLTDTREGGGDDADGDGSPDACTTVTASGACSAGGIVTLANTDNTAPEDLLDLDSDGDGYTDQDEAFDGTGDGVSDNAPSGTDTDGDGLDDAFDPDCTAGACGSVVGVFVTDVLTAAQDSDGDGTADWLQTCGDAYLSSGESCDDGDGVDNDTCSNACLDGVGQGCATGAECVSTLCDGTLGTCQVCVDNQASGQDSGCAVGAGTCTTVGATNTCRVCADDATGLDADDGCGGGTPLCDIAAAGGLGACVQCLDNGDCDDSDQCTQDTCGATNTCGSTPLSAGTSCNSGAGVCDGLAAPACKTCIDTQAAGTADAGCSGTTPACDAAANGGNGACVACTGDGDCGSSGVCSPSLTCVTCLDSATGADPDHGCGGGTPLCNAAAAGGLGACVACFDDQTGDAGDVGCGGATPVCNPTSNTCATCVDASGNDDFGCGGATALCDTSASGGLGACVQCLGIGDCDDAIECTENLCTAGACGNPPSTAGTTCGGGSGVCDGQAAPVCKTCIDNQAAGTADAGCSGATPACDAAANGGGGACVGCRADGDCTGGVCSPSQTCVTCLDSATGADADHGCGGATPLCNAATAGGAGNACVSCFDDQTGDAADVGCAGATPVCNATTNTCATCLDAIGNDDDGCTGTTELCNTTGGAGLGVCAECLGDLDCDDANDCTTDTCTAGVCDSETLIAGTSCDSGAGVCDGESTPVCLTCLDDEAPGSTDSGCEAGTPLCDESGAAPVCVECLAQSDCPSGEYCSLQNACAPGCGTDPDCSAFPQTPVCDTAGMTCVQCLDDDDCLGIQVCLSSSATCSAPDRDADGVSDENDGDDDNDRIADAVELGGQDGSLDTDADGIPDYRDADLNTCDDTTPDDGDCDTVPAAFDADGDGIANHLDRDSDGDGLTDAREAGAPGSADGDGDGVADDCLPVDVSGLCDGGVVDVPADTDTLAPPDFLDPDSDEDTLSDHVEAFDTNDDETADVLPAAVDTDGDGIDDAFDPDCEVAGDCDGVLGAPVLAALTAAQDADTDGTADWLELCGDAYVKGTEACDDANAIDTDACSDQCLFGLTETCAGDAECESSVCDDTLQTCQACEDSAGSGTDSGCSVDAPTCTTADTTNACVVCANDQAGATADDGCSGTTSLCDATAAGGLGACVSCVTASDCDDANECTGESCTAGVCASTSLTAGVVCSTGVCNGANAALCVPCIDDAAVGAQDSGCSIASPACNTAGITAVCAACLVDGDCTTGVCIANACATCADDQTGTGTDRGCSTTTPLCTGSGATLACVGCLTSADCADGYCSANTCMPGCAANADCADTPATPVCAVASNDCVQCVADTDCADGYCSGNTCMPGCATNSDCAGTPATPVCDTADSECVECLTDAQCRGQQQCSAASTCELEDSDGDGLADDVDSDDDGDGIRDADELGGTDRSGDEDGDGIPDYIDKDEVSCTDTQGMCNDVPAAYDLDDDGTANHLDLDADGDGIPDATEGHDADLDGAPDREPADEDEDADGLDDAFDGDCSSASPCGSVVGVIAPRPDTDDDGDRNFLDADDDGDQRSTKQERDDAAGYDGSAAEGADIDGDDVRNWYETDSDGDGALDLSENMNGGDANEDGLLDYLDPAFRAVDTDGDGVIDVVECPAPAHPDNDDCPDSDDDGKPDYEDTDDDGDGVPTEDELEAGDTDDDDDPNYLDPDDDGDGVPTEDERKDGKNQDSDGDGKPNHVDTDDDGDGIPTEQEFSDGDEFGNDIDDDGVPNYLDEDSDGDGTPDEVEAEEDDDDDGVPDYLQKRGRGKFAGGALCSLSDSPRSAHGMSLIGLGLLALGAALLVRRTRGHRNGKVN